ncbi:hypothetical protein ACFYT4_06205 [Streptomyces sp. NPDC004609]|uniref:hypothetical protein n=1 Tax=Streptomyces sp. NPDC004609 TaxID=3364704 RepID=UPI003684CB16
MEREQLERLLSGGDGTSSAALSALRAGASHIVWDGTASADSLAKIYGRRLRHTLRRGIETSGLAQAVQRLDLHGRSVRLGQIRTADGSWVFMLFLDEDGGTLVACTGVRQAQERVRDCPPGFKWVRLWECLRRSVPSERT